MNIGFHCKMIQRICKRFVCKRRYFKRIVFAILVFVSSFYLSILVFSELKSPRILTLTQLDRCPACYGISICPELYSNQITLESYNGWMALFNIKNVFYGYTTSSDRRIILKKLAHDWELKDFDSKLCKYWNLEDTCTPYSLLNVSNVEEKIISMVQYNLSAPETKPRKGLILCPYPYSFYDMVKTITRQGNLNYNSEIINLWTMLNLNPEPIILQILQKSKGWPVPSYAGVCGRLEIVANEGEPLSSLLYVEWYRKLKYAIKILEAAMDFTFKHDKFRFYLMDWSLDNIVANELDEIAFVDLEDVIVLDKHISPKKDLPNWYQRDERNVIVTGFTFSIDNICKHHLSDHNLWAACYVLANDDNGLLYPIPNDINTSRPHLDKLLRLCLNGEDRFDTVTKLQQVMKDMLSNQKAYGYGGG